MFQAELAGQGPYKTSIGGIRLKLQKLQKENTEAQKMKTEKRESWEEIDGVLHHQSLPYIFELIRTKLICRYHNDLLTGHFSIKKSHKLITKKYY